MGDSSPGQSTLIGRVAEFCPICREAREFQIALGRHLPKLLAFPPLLALSHRGSAPTPGLVMTCDDCGVELPAAEEDYRTIAEGSPPVLDELIRETQPDLPTRVAGRMRLEARVGDGSLEGGRRREVMQETVQVLDASWQMRPRKKALRLRNAFLVPALLFLSAVSWGSVFPREYRDTVGAFSAMMVMGSLVWMIVAVIATLSRRSKRKAEVRYRLEPLLGRAWKPLRPTSEEIDLICRDFRTGERDWPGFVNASRVLAEMDAVRRA